jgi:hypothetical protein
MLPIAAVAARFPWALSWHRGAHLGVSSQAAAVGTATILEII